MSSSPVRRALILSTLVLPLTLPAPASAHGPTECVAGPTRLASAENPAIVDSHEDMTAYGTLYGPSADLISAWITGPSAWADRASTQKVVAHMRVEELDRPPVLARYYFVYSGDEQERWVRAVFTAPDSWSFAHGVLNNGTSFAQEGTTTGSVDTATGIISIDIPKSTLAPRPADGQSLDLGTVFARSYLRHEPTPVPTPAGGNLKLVDEALGGDCAITLYEEDPLRAA